MFWQIHTLPSTELGRFAEMRHILEVSWLIFLIISSVKTPEREQKAVNDTRIKPLVTEHAEETCV